MNDQHTRSARLRYTATGALAALAAVGAVAGAGALAAKPHAKAPTVAVADKTHAPQPAVNHQPFLDAIQQLVSSGLITASEAQVVDREIVTGRVDTDTLVSSGFTQTQLRAVERALGNAKRALEPARQRTSK